MHQGISLYPPKHKAMEGLVSTQLVMLHQIFAYTKPNGFNYCKRSCKAGLAIVTNTVGNAIEIPTLATKNAPLVASFGKFTSEDSE